MPSFACRVCGKSYQLASDLAYHKKIRHTQRSAATASTARSSGNGGGVTVTVLTQKGRNKQGQLTTTTLHGSGQVRHQVTYKGGKLVEPKAAKKGKKGRDADLLIDPSKSTPTPQTMQRSGSVSASPMVTARCPSCRTKNKFDQGTPLVMCYACHATFTPRQ